MSNYSIQYLRNLILSFPSISRLQRRSAAQVRSTSAPDNFLATRAAVDWLCTAQDKSASQDGGVARHYSLVDGWSVSYPETTGYIVPTMFAVADLFGDSTLERRALGMLKWLCEIQTPCGGFPGGVVGAKEHGPVTFNTGQVLIGLASGAARTRDPQFLAATQLAADWLRDTQDPDGCWRAFPTPYAKKGEKTYETHVSWGLIAAERVLPTRGYGLAARRNIEWAISKQLPNGWFEGNCLTNIEAPLTHTIGYALRGIIEGWLYFRGSNFLRSACLCADALLGCIQPDGQLSARFDSKWAPAAKYSCLTGLAQISSCFFLLAHDTHRAEYIEAGKRLNRFLRKTILLTGDDGIKGGVSGSYPIGGAYGRWEYLNWAAKFSIDAFLHEMAFKES
jgi:hypothetical protein